jgi:hypothetical protein
MDNRAVAYTDDHVGLLRDARALIEDPDHWCQHHIAEDRLGNPTAEDAPEACRWCVSGAFLRVGKERGGYPHQGRRFDETVYGQTWNALNARRSAVSVNDCDGHDAVLALIDETIARLKIKSGLAEIDTTIDRLEKNKNDGE